MEGKVKASITSQSLCVIAEEVVITLQIGPFFHLGTRVGGCRSQRGGDGSQDRKKAPP